MLKFWIWATTVLVVIIPVVIWRIWSIVPPHHLTKYYPERKNKPGSIMVLLGSGGHTGEMLRLLRELDIQKYHTRIYIHYPNDKVSLEKAMAFEKKKCRALDKSKQGICHIAHIPKAREVGQSWVTTIWSSFLSLWFALKVAYRDPDVVSVTCVYLLGRSLRTRSSASHSRN
jgi:beta-1,4-N-acetylglucosaminyltransferase